jgi:hypothetical protein
MDVMAVLLSSIKHKNHRPFIIKLLDQIFEEFERSIERNDFKES